MLENCPLGSNKKKYPWEYFCCWAKRTSFNKILLRSKSDATLGEWVHSEWWNTCLVPEADLGTADRELSWNSGLGVAMSVKFHAKIAICLKSESYEILQFFFFLSDSPALRTSLKGKWSLLSGLFPLFWFSITFSGQNEVWTHWNFHFCDIYLQCGVNSFIKR